MWHYSPSCPRQVVGWPHWQGGVVHEFLTVGLLMACVTPLFLLNATMTDQQILIWCFSMHLPQTGNRNGQVKAQGGLAVCLYLTVLEEDARPAVEDLERTALLQALRQAVGAEAGEGLGGAGKGMLGLLGGLHSY